MGTNCLGPYLLTKLLLPVLQRTAASSPAGTVRVTWASSLATEVSAPPGGITFDAQGAPSILGKGANYAQTKVGNVFLSNELAKRHGKDGIISVVSGFFPSFHVLFSTSVVLEPRPARHRTRSTPLPFARVHHCKSRLERSSDKVAPVLPLVDVIYMGLLTGFCSIQRKLFLYPPKLGAYTELYAGYSPAITAEQNGAYIIPWGRLGMLRPDVQEQMTAEGGGSIKFWEWCEKETSQWV
jgi:retinol dehydrogenase 12